VQQLEMEDNYLKNLCQKLRSDLTEAEQKRVEVGIRLEQERKNSPPPMPDLSDLLEFASRVIPIEQELVGQLEAELRKKNCQLAALSDMESTQPKLSLLLNCMGMEQAAIAATAHLDSKIFKIQTKLSGLLLPSCRSKISAMAFKDLLYCGEMLREAPFPFSTHVEACTVCQQQSPAQLIEFIEGLDGVDLPSDILEQDRINGKCILFCNSDDFPNLPQKEVMEAINRLRDIHFDVLDAQAKR